MDSYKVFREILSQETVFVIPNERPEIYNLPYEQPMSPERSIDIEEDNGYSTPPNTHHESSEDPATSDTQTQDEGQSTNGNSENGNPTHQKGGNEDSINEITMCNDYDYDDDYYEEEADDDENDDYSDGVDGDDDDCYANEDQK